MKHSECFPDVMPVFLRWISPADARHGVQIRQPPAVVEVVEEFMVLEEEQEVTEVMFLEKTQVVMYQAITIQV